MSFTIIDNESGKKVELTQDEMEQVRHAVQVQVDIFNDTVTEPTYLDAYPAEADVIHTMRAELDKRITSLLDTKTAQVRLDHLMN